MKFYYDSPEAKQRANSARELQAYTEKQLVLLKKMRSGDGRTVEYRNMDEEARRLEKQIQLCIFNIINPEVEEEESK